MEGATLPPDILYEICELLDTNTLANFVACNKYFICNKYLQLLNSNIINVVELQQKDIYKLLITRYESMNNHYGIFDYINNNHKLLLQNTDCAIIVGCKDATERMTVQSCRAKREMGQT